MSGNEQKDDSENLLNRENNKEKQQNINNLLTKKDFEPYPSPLYSDSPLISDREKSRSKLTENEETKQLLKYVAEGEQDKAEALVKKNPNLLLVKGDVTDLSKREFKGITPFQYAFWALDWHMWTMLLKYIKQEEAALQWKELATQGTAYGIQANWQNLIDAYTEYASLMQAGSFEAAAITWREKIGKAQLSLPAHVANEFCHSGRSLSSFKYFKDSEKEPKLTRSRISAGLDWYNEGCGKEWAHYRWSLPQVTRIKLDSSVRFANLEKDGESLLLLLKKRQQQADSLTKTLATTIESTYTPPSTTNNNF